MVAPSFLTDGSTIARTSLDRPASTIARPAGALRPEYADVRGSISDMNGACPAFRAFNAGDDPRPQFARQLIAQPGR